MFRIDQTGLSAGQLGKSRTDGLATGATVTLTYVGYGSFRPRLLWVPIGASSAPLTLTEVSAGVWQFSPVAGAYGTYRIEGIENEGKSNERRVVRVFVVRTPSGLIIPAFGERANALANITNASAATIDQSENNATDFANTSQNLVPWAGTARATHEWVTRLDRAQLTFGPFASIAEFRAATPPTTEVLFTISGKAWRFSPTETSADDGLNFLRPTAIDAGAAGRAVPVYAAGVTIGLAGPDVALASDSSTIVLATTLTGLSASRKYLVTFGVRVSIWQEGTESNCGDFDCKFGAYITTNSSSVATISLLTTPVFDSSLVASALTSVSISLIASLGGFTIRATRPTGVSCSAAAEWWSARVRDIT